MSDTQNSGAASTGAAQRQVTCSAAINGKITAGSTARRHTCRAPAAVIVQVNVQPLAWNIGNVQRYRSAMVIGRWTSVPTAFTHAFRCVIITPLGRDVVPLV